MCGTDACITTMKAEGASCMAPGQVSDPCTAGSCQNDLDPDRLFTVTITSATANSTDNGTVWDSNGTAATEGTGMEGHSTASTSTGGARRW